MLAEVDFLDLWHRHRELYLFLLLPTRYKNPQPRNTCIANWKLSSRGAGPKNLGKVSEKCQPS
jgi:hypothetical protein